MAKFGLEDVSRVKGLHRRKHILALSIRIALLLKESASTSMSALAVMV